MFLHLGRVGSMLALLVGGLFAGQAQAAAEASSLGQRLHNPFVGAKWYVNPKWRENVMKEPRGKRIANTGTAVWLDRIGAIAPADGKSWGLVAHLDEALRQKANLVGVVLYNLPNRDCSALASSGELLIAKGGFKRYQEEYIGPIAQILSQEKYRTLRIIAIIEPDSLPNLVTNLSIPKCKEAAGPGGYVDGVGRKPGQGDCADRRHDQGHASWRGKRGGLHHQHSQLHAAA